MQVTIISGPTGCGKTTRVPQFILEHAEASHKPVNIIVTQVLLHSFYNCFRILIVTGRVVIENEA